ncbi:uncharacterized protein LOC135497605 [Lineus longissimus]|uniref:uncharacterized protein LOC135497605 n=1 Tax=Lineus longissimus TaxID=88925 RepID=UPI002B4EACA9
MLQSLVFVSSILLILWNVIGSRSLDYEPVACFLAPRNGKSVDLKGTHVKNFKSSLDFSALEKTVVHPCYELLKHNNDVLYFGIFDHSECYSFKKGWLNIELLKHPSRECKDGKVGGKDTIFLYKIRQYTEYGCFLTTSEGKSIDLKGTMVANFKSALIDSALDKTVVHPCYDTLKDNEDVLYFGIVDNSECYSFKKGWHNRDILAQPSDRCTDGKVGGKDTVFLYTIRRHWKKDEL